MKFIEFTKAKLKGIFDAIVRFYTVFVLLVSVAVLSSISIETDVDMERHIISLVFGAFCFLTAHVMGERFGKNAVVKGLYLAGALAATAAYYAYMLNVDRVEEAVIIRTITLIFALFVAFIWIPSIKRDTDFNAVFLSVFKAFFTSVFFSGIIYGGICLIITAIDQLLFNVDYNAYGHTSFVVWIVWAPMLMLSLIPVFQGGMSDAAKVEKATSYPKFLEILLTYVLIPLISVYTLVLVIYMVKTVAVGDWSNNLLEPLLLSYLVAVVIIYVLVKRLGNAFTRYFVRIFPALMAAIAVFQLAESIMKAQEEGFFISRYYVLMFSIYSIIIGVLLSLLSKKKNGYVAYFAIIFALISAAPIIGASDVSFGSQSAIVRNTLKDNGMLSGNVLTPSDNLTEEDKSRITRGIEYLYSFNEIDRLEFLPDGFNPYQNFEAVLGFDPYRTEIIDKTSKSYYIDESRPAGISGYDYLVSASIYLPLGKNENVVDVTTVQGGEEYILKLVGNNDKTKTAAILYRGNEKLLEAPLGGMIDTIRGYSDADGFLGSEKLTFDYENVSAKIRVVFRSISIYGSGDEENVNAYIFILYSIK